MKRYIRSNEPVDEAEADWSEYLFTKTYIVNGGEKSFKTDDPKEAITRWFQYSAKYPLDCAIFVTNRKDGVALLKAATPELIEKLASTYKCPYKVSYLLDSIQKSIDNGCRYVLEGPYGDQVHPFAYG